MGNQRVDRLETTARGRAVLTDPRLNRGTAFTAAERRALGLVGLLPQAVVTQDQQAARVYEQFRSQPTALEKFVSLSSLRDRNEVLFYRLVTDHLAELLPIVYTPTVGTAIERYNAEYRRPHGVYLSVDAPEDIERSLRASGLGPEDVDLIVATDGEAILGIGDWGVGGVDIAVGKLVVYTAAAGIDPARVLPVMLDVGTNRQDLLDDPGYLGNRHPRADREAYDAFIDAYVQNACSRTRCCTGRTSARRTPTGSWTATGTRSSPSTTTSRAPARSPWPPSWPGSRPAAGHCASTASWSSARAVPGSASRTTCATPSPPTAWRRPTPRRASGAWTATAC